MAEYGLLLAVIAVVVVAAALILGQSISILFLGVSGSLGRAAPRRRIGGAAERVVPSRGAIPPRTSRSH